MTSTIGNIVPTSDGRGRPVCSSCGTISRTALDLHQDGGIFLPTMSIPSGWSVAPYPTRYQHSDGTIGDLFTCRACNRALARGESVYRTDRRKQQLGLVTA